MPPKKDTPKKDHVVEIGFIIIICLFLWVIWSIIFRYISSATKLSWQVLADFFLTYIYPITIVLAVIVSIFAIYGIIKNYFELLALNKEETKIFGSPKIKEEDVDDLPLKDERWENVLSKVNSPNAADWRLAVIEADVMLDEVLRAQGYVGDSIGDMLKGIQKSDMTTLDQAWEAHKIRNEIVHSGSDFRLNERDAKRAISLYEAVFRELQLI